MTAVLEVIASPWSWVVGVAGFLARGGALVFLLPIAPLPTPVGVTLLLPPVSIDTSGASPALVRELLVVGAVLAVVAVASLVLAALADIAAFLWIAARLPRADGDVALAGVASGPAVAIATDTGTRGLLAPLVVARTLALVPAILASLVAARALVDVGEREYILPSSLAVPYVVRVVQGAWVELVAVAACLVVADAADALSSRRLLRRALRLPPPADAHGARFVTRALGAWVAGWLATAVTVAPGLVLVGAAWPMVRDGYAATLSPTPPPPVALFAMTAVFVASWLAALAIAGIGSAVRAATWSAATAT